MDEFLILLQAKLDEAKSKGNVNADINKIQSQIDKLKIQAEINPKAISNLDKQLESVLNQKINISNIGIDQSKAIKTAQQTGQQIGSAISQGIETSINKTKNTLKSFTDLRNFSELNKSISNIRVDSSKLKNYKSILDDVKNTYAEFGQVKITNETFNNGILEKFKVNIEQVNGDLKETKSFMMSLTEDKNAFVFNGLISGSESVVQHLDKTKNAVNQTADAINALKEKAQIDKIQLSLDNGDYDTQLLSYETALQKLGLSSTKVAEKMKDATTAYYELKSSLTDNNIVPDNIISKAQTLETEMSKLSNTVKQIKLKESLQADNLQVEQTILRLNKQLMDNGKYSKNAKAKIRAWIAELEKGGTASARLKQINVETKELHANMVALNRSGQGFFETLKSKMGSLGSYLSASALIGSTFQVIRSGISTVKDLDDSLLELSKVSDLSADGLAEVTNQAYELGESVGKTGKQVIDAVTTFKRAGFDLTQSTQLAEDALKMTNVAEGINEASDSAQYLISIMKGYQNTSNEFSAKILDSINEVSNTQSVDFDNLADGAQRLSAVANQAGVSFDQMLGILTGGYEVLGNMEKTASGLITIFTRLQSIQLSDEEEVESVAKLQETFNNATNGVVNIVDQTTGQLRNAYDILADLNTVWDTLDKNTQEGLAFAAGGTRQKSVFLSIMSNWESVEKSVRSATDSMGSAEIENEKYLDSISGKVSQFSSSVEKLSKDVIGSDIVKWFVDLGTTGVKAIDGLVNALTPLGTIGVIGGGIAGAKNWG